MSSSTKPPYDPEMVPVMEAIPSWPPLTIESLPEMRKALESFGSKEAVLADPEITLEEVAIPGPGGEIKLAIIQSTKSIGRSRPAIYHIHGGGMIVGSRFFMQSAQFLSWVKEFDAVLISVEYRLAPESSDPALIEDCYAGLKWVAGHTSELGINPEKIMITGASAGGGLAAGLALLARDRGGPKICAQYLFYPMLDDRLCTTSTKQFMHEGTWKGNTNGVAWNWYLAGKRGGEDVSIYAAPARAKDLSSLPPAFIEVGSCDLFRDEDVAYATKLWECGGEAELHVWPGAFHGYDIYAPETQISKDSWEVRTRWLRRNLL